MRLELDLMIELDRVEGTNTITVRSNRDSAASMKLDAVDFAEIRVVDQDISFSYDYSHLTLKLETPMAKNETREITIRYVVENPVAGLYFSHPDTHYPNRPLYVGSDHETTRARHWMPSIDHPSVRTTFEFVLTSDESHTILAIGKKIGETVENGRKTVHWKHDFPCPTYIAAIAAGELTEFVDTDANSGEGMIPVAYYTSSNYSPENLKLSFDRTPKMIEWFVNKFDISIPWAKYYQFAFLRISGAMENQSLVSWGDFAILNEETHGQLGTGIDDVNIHEMAHTFFGDTVVIRDWSHAWLKESWATYCSTLWYEDWFDRDHMLLDLYHNAMGYFSETKRYIRSVVTRKFDSSWELFDNHLYPGGAWRLHMLRRLVGDTQFFAGVKEYLREYRGKTVETIDFMRMLEKHSGMSLSEFFDQWIYHPKGYPKIKLSFSYDQDKKLGTFTVEQTQVDLGKTDITSTPFKFDLDLAWYLDGQYYTETIGISNKFHEFTVSIDTKPEHVILDPEAKVLLELDLEISQEYLESLLQHGTVIGRILASKKLVASGKQKSIQTVANHLANEQFWGVRRQIYKHLGSANSQFAIAPLIDSVSREQHHVALSELMVVIGNYRDSKVEDILIEALQRSLPPYVRKEAIKSLGKQMTSKSMDVIQAYLVQDDWKQISRGGAFSVLGSSRDRQHVPILIEAVQPGAQSEYIRGEIISALGTLGSWVPKKEKAEIREALEDLLREPYAEIRMVAARALQTMNAKSSISKLEQAKGTFTHQEMLSIEKIIQNLRKSEDGSQDLKKRLEDAEKKIMKLEEQVQKLKND
jgi:aminopeptidase N